MSRPAFVPWALALFLTSGCEVKPFSVVAPELEQRLGGALVSVTVPPFTRGLIQRVQLQVTSPPSDTSRMRPITRNMNFPSPGGNLSVGDVADIPVGVRRFTVRAYDTADILRFRGSADSAIAFNQTRLIHVTMSPVGGAIDFRITIDPSTVDSSVIDSAGIALLPATSVLDILEIVDNPFHPAAGLLPILSVGLGDRFAIDSEGRFTKLFSVRQVPIGNRVFVAHLKDLSSRGTIAFADTISPPVFIDTLRTARSEFVMKLARDPATISAIYTKDTLPPDSSVVVVTPQF